MKKYTFTLALCFVFSACMHTMYVGETTFIDNNQTCPAQVVWYETNYLLGTKTDKTLTLVSAGQRLSMQFQEKENGILYLGDSSSDSTVINNDLGIDEMVCGFVQDVNSLSEFEGDELMILIYCERKSDPITRGKGYIPANKDPYIFAITTEKVRNLFGGVPDAPEPQDCTDSM